MDTETEKGGISYGGGSFFTINFSWPFVTLQADEHSLVIRISFGWLWKRTYSLKRSDIVSIRRKQCFSQGILIEHTREDYPPYLVFWPLHYSAVEKRLEELGYRVSRR